MVNHKCENCQFTFRCSGRKKHTDAWLCKCRSTIMSETATEKCRMAFLCSDDCEFEIFADSGDESEVEDQLGINLFSSSRSKQRA